MEVYEQKGYGYITGKTMDIKMWILYKHFLKGLTDEYATAYTSLYIEPVADMHPVHNTIYTKHLTM